MQGELLTTAHIDALDSCYDQPLPVTEIGDDDTWWQLFYDLRDAGFVHFDDNSTAITITPAGVAHLDTDEDSEDEVTNKTAGYDVDYVSFLDTFYDEPVPADEVAEWWQDVQHMIGNGHLILKDGYLYITDAGRALL